MISAVIIMDASMPCKYGTEEIKTNVKSGKATCLKVNKTLKLDGAKFKVANVIKAEDRIYINYSVFFKGNDRCFPFSDIIIKDDKGNLYKPQAIYVNSTVFSDNCCQAYDALKKEASKLIVSYDSHGRNFVMEIPVN